jgi:hypothetical protein
MDDSGSRQSEPAEWFQPGSYSLWVFERGDDKEPILLAAYEWEKAGLRAVRAECVWLHEEEDQGVDWEDYPEFNEISGGVEAAVFASLIEEGKLHRIGVLPTIGRYAEPPSSLRSTSSHSIPATPTS